MVIDRLPFYPCYMWLYIHVICDCVSMLYVTVYPLSMSYVTVYPCYMWLCIHVICDCVSMLYVTVYSCYMLVCIHVICDWVYMLYVTVYLCYTWLCIHVICDCVSMFYVTVYPVICDCVSMSYVTVYTCCDCVSMLYLIFSMFLFKTLFSFKTTDFQFFLTLHFKCQNIFVQIGYFMAQISQMIRQKCIPCTNALQCTSVHERSRN